MASGMFLIDFFTKEETKAAGFNLEEYVSEKFEDWPECALFELIEDCARDIEKAYELGLKAGEAA
jgi:hypothetical protein